MNTIINLIEKTYYFLWGDWIHLPLPGGTTINLPLLVLLLVPTGIFCTIRTRFLQIRMLPDMLRALLEKAETGHKGGSLSALQALIVSTATRVGMGNLVGIVAALSAGGAGALFWMWVTALLGSATAFIEATLAQLHKQPDPLYGGYRGGPAYYIHDWINSKRQKQGTPVSKKNLLSVLFALSGLICWCGISQVISNSVTSSFKNAFGIPPIYSCLFLVLLAAVIVLRKNASVRVLDLLVPIIAGGFGAVLMNGVKRGLFSNEAGSGSAPCAAATAETSHPAKVGLMQAMGVFIDTLLCTCTAMIMLLVPADKISGLEGMDLLQAAMSWHFGELGVIFIAVILWLFSFTTFIGILFYARSNVSYLVGDTWAAQTAYKILALIMMFVGGLTAYTFVWDLGDVGVGLMTVFNLIALIPMSKEALVSLRDYEAKYKKS